MIVKDRQTAIDLTILGYGNEAEFFHLHKDNGDLIVAIEDGVETVEIPGPFAVGHVLEINTDNIDQNILKVLARATTELATKTEDLIDPVNTEGFPYTFPYILS